MGTPLLLTLLFVLQSGKVGWLMTLSIRNCETALRLDRQKIEEAAAFARSAFHTHQGIISSDLQAMKDEVYDEEMELSGAWVGIRRLRGLDSS